MHGGVTIKPKESMIPNLNQRPLPCPKNNINDAKPITSTNYIQP
jgi:hypothetical protein